jgi:hypothetical protein
MNKYWIETKIENKEITLEILEKGNAVIKLGNSISVNNNTICIIIIKADENFFNLNQNNKYFTINRDSINSIKMAI